MKKPVQGNLDTGRVSFRCPHRGVVVNGRLGTKDPIRAARICRDLTFFRDAPAPFALAKSELVLRHPRAVEIFFGASSRQAGWVSGLEPEGQSPDVYVFMGALLNEVAEDLQLDEDGQGRLANSIVRFADAARADLQAEVEDLRAKVAALAPELDDANARVTELERARNIHVRTTVGEAFDGWLAEYRPTHSAMTVSNAVHAIEGFVASVPKARGARLGDLRPEHVAAWLRDMKPERPLKGRDTIAPATKVARRAYLRSFLTWCCWHHGLSENVAASGPPIMGAARTPEHIVAIRRREDISKLLEDLAPQPYWRAWVAVACLAGPRWGEQARLKLEDVYLDDGYFRVATLTGGRRPKGTKTGKERNVPIERTVLRPILKAHLEVRAKERKKKGATPGERSAWLFPTIVPDNPYMPRVKAPPGQWSHNRTWVRAWEAATDVCTGRAGEEPEGGWPERAAYWSYGPAQWRHTFGTVLGMCGWGSLEIARVMGNSEDVAKRHYVAATAQGQSKRWGFKF